MAAASQAGARPILAQQIHPDRGAAIHTIKGTVTRSQSIQFHPPNALVVSGWDSGSMLKYNSENAAPPSITC